MGFGMLLNMGLRNRITCVKKCVSAPSLSLLGSYTTGAVAKENRGSTCASSECHLPAHATLIRTEYTAAEVVLA